MGVPYTFASATNSIPLSQLDANFNTPVTIGTSTVGLGNTTTSLVGLSNVSTTALTVTNDASISGLTVGKGGGALGNNTAIGNNALLTNSSGNQNSAFGEGALQKNTAGGDNTGIGFAALFATTTGGQNTALGREALQANTTASNNTAVGYQAGYALTTANYNVAIGYQAGLALTGSGTTGANTFVGPQSGYLITSGTNNTILGGYTGNNGGLDIRTASNYIVLSDGAGNPRAYWTSTGQFFFNSSVSNDVAGEILNNSATTPYGLYVALTAASPNNTSQYVFRAQDSTTSVYTIWSNGTTAGRSDERLKKNIVDATPKLEDICKLQVRNYEWIESVNGSKEIGLIAQEVEKVFPSLVTTNDKEKDGDDYKQVKYSVFVPMLVKAIQELNATVTAQAATIAALQAKIGA
jgi:hypothetical protein